MIGDERGVESLMASEMGEGGKGMMEGSVSGGGEGGDMETPGVIDQGSHKDAFLDGISIGKAGTGSNVSLLYEAMESLLDGNSEVSQSVSIDVMEDRREESFKEEVDGLHGWMKGESG